MSNGVSNIISFVLESAWGVAGNPDKSLPINFTGGIKTSNETKFQNAAKGVLAKNLNSIIGNRKHEGDYEMDLDADYASYLFFSALGKSTAAAVNGETAVFTHAITELEAKPSLTIEQSIGEDVRRFAGAIATGFKLTAKTNDYVKVDFPLKAQSADTATSSEPAFATDSKPFSFQQVDVKVAGASLKEVTSFELEYANNAEFNYALSGSNDPAFVAIKPSEVKGKIEMYLDDTSLAQLTAYLADTEQSLEVVITGEAVGEASAYKFDLTVPRSVFTTGETKISDDYNLLTVEFEGMYDTATSELLDLKITNKISDLNLSES